MKKRMLVLLLMMSLVIASLAACGGGGDTQEDAADTSASNEILFHDNVFENDDVRVEITKYEVIQPGDTTYNEYNEKEYSDGPVIAFWYNATNKSGDDIDAISAWFEGNFKAVQDNDPNKINELEVSSLPDERFLESQSETIKKDGTVENCIGYILDDEITPVTLISENYIDGGDYGTQVFDIANLSKQNDDSAKASNDGDGELSADFKKTMDDYEAWFDHYCEVMKKYKENSSDLSLLTEMTELLSEETTMLQQMEDMDQSEMNTAELAYYIEVTARIEKKLLEVAY